jgi:hypothetical protein
VQNVAGRLRQIVAGQFVKLTEYFKIVLRYLQATSNKLRQSVQFKKNYKKFIIGELTKGEI